jgi:3-phenylpropionate/trans-cinnamate dioxygenase ferredoxin reductase subunit
VSHRPQRIVIVGASLAGLRSAQALREEGFEGEVLMLGEEPYTPYDRPPLSKGLLAGSQEPAQLELRGVAQLEASWLLGDPACRLDSGRRLITTRSGRTIAYDRVLIATGSVPRRIPALNPSRPGVHELRTLDDALALRQALAGARKLAIVGAGFIGVEVASTARSLGLEVDLVSLDPPLAAVGSLVSTLTTQLLAEHEVGLHLSRSVVAVEGTPRVERLLLDDGTRVEADVVLSAVGAVPATAWLKDSGLRLQDGVVCDAWCAALGADGVVAAGDVARWPNRLFGETPIRVEHWTNAGEQARVAAHTMLHGSGHGEPHTSVPSFWSEHFGLRLQSVGLPGHGDPLEVLNGDLAQRRFVATSRRGGRLVGAVAYGMPRALVALRAELAAPAGEVTAGPAR